MKKYLVVFHMERLDKVELEVETDDPSKIEDMVDDLALDDLANHQWITTTSGKVSPLSVSCYEDGYFELATDIYIEEVRND
jgi:hypothetical protein